jgi:ankyrin repeat protein
MAVLQLDRILVERTATKIRKALQLLPSKLEDTYKETILRIKNQAEPDNSLGMRILMWISKSKRPFYVEELQHALAVEWSDHEDPPRSLDHGNVLDPEDLVSVCAGLAIIETESKIIRLVHFTTEEFFRSSPETLFPHADVQISKVCLAYLLFDEFCDGRSHSADELDNRVEECPFLLYAAVYWHEHYRGEHDLAIENMALAFLNSLGSIAASCQMKHLNSFLHIRWKINKSVVNQLLRDWQETGLHIASTHGFHRLVAKQLEAGVEVDPFDSMTCTPLERAAEGGHESVVRLLLEHGADVDSKRPCQNHTPLSGATAEEYMMQEGIADYLMQQTPLCAAADKGHEAIVQLLLEKGAEIDWKDRRGCTPLTISAVRGHVAVVKLLLKHGAEADPRDFIGRTPLSFAAERGNNTLVKILLKEQVAINSIDVYGLTPLMHACRQGYTAVAKLLLEQGADTSSPGFGTVFYLKENFEYGNLIQELAEHGADTVVESRLHVDKEPKLTSQVVTTENIRHLLGSKSSKYLVDCQGSNGLHYAAAGAQLECVNYLLDFGLDVEARDNKGFTALHCAVLGRSFAVVERILQCFPSKWPNWETNNEWSPLHLAARRGNLRMLRLLFDAGIRDHTVETSEPPGKWNAFSIAVFHRNKRLIARDISVEDQHASGEKNESEFFTWLRKQRSVGFTEGKRNGNRRCQGCGNVSFPSKKCYWREI